MSPLNNAFEDSWGPILIIWSCPLLIWSQNGGKEASIACSFFYTPVGMAHGATPKLSERTQKLKIEKKIGMKNVLQQRLNVSFKQRRH
jgi:hypothetical protein